MKISVIFDPDSDFGPEEGDAGGPDRRLGMFIDADHEDVILIHREYHQRFAGGARTKIVGTGIWENVSLKAFEAALAELEKL